MKNTKKHAAKIQTPTPSKAQELSLDLLRAVVGGATNTKEEARK
jgi:hypothetical protein